MMDSVPKRAENKKFCTVLFWSLRKVQSYIALNHQFYSMYMDIFTQCPFFWLEISFALIIITQFGLSLNLNLAPCLVLFHVFYILFDKIILIIWTIIFIHKKYVCCCSCLCVYSFDLYINIYIYFVLILFFGYIHVLCGSISFAMARLNTLFTCIIWLEYANNKNTLTRFLYVYAV